MTDDQFKAQLIAALTRIALAEERIAVVAEIQMEPPPKEPAPTECPHPDEARASFGVTGGVEDWQCGVCGYRTVVEVPV